MPQVFSKPYSNELNVATRPDGCVTNHHGVDGVLGSTDLGSSYDVARLDQVLSSGNINSTVEEVVERQEEKIMHHNTNTTQLSTSTFNTTVHYGSNFSERLENIINNEREHEENLNIWNGSRYAHIRLLESNNVGKVGEKYLQSCCDECEIPAHIDGSTTKEIGGGNGDGDINGCSVEIKTARQGTSSARSFQHELGESPWNAKYMAFIDISPEHVYLSIFPNMTEEQYKQVGFKCPYFPTKGITWRKGKGAFKLDTTVSINEVQSKVENGNTIKIDDSLNIEDLKNFINRIVI